MIFGEPIGYWILFWAIIILADVGAVEWELYRRKAETSAKFDTLAQLKKLAKRKGYKRKMKPIIDKLQEENNNDAS